MTIISLHAVNYSDTHAILSAYSREEGRLSLLLRLGSGREANRRRALLMPLSIVECTLSGAGRGRDLPSIREVSPLMPLHGVHSNPLKAQVAMFVAEVLQNVLRESQADEPLFMFLVDSISRLDSCPNASVMNFAIAFLRQLSRFVGIEPDFTSWRPGYIFDIADGRFRQSAPLHGSYLTPEESEVANLLGRMTYGNMHRFRFNRAQRGALVDRILGYYTVHLAPLTNLSTLPVLRSL